MSLGVKMSLGIKTLSAFWIAGAIWAFASISSAQETPQEDIPDTDPDEDVVVVTGRRRVDYAMQAFQNGDFATAEIEFKANAMCALRRERNLTASIERSVREAARSDISQAAQSSNSGANSRGAGAGSRSGPSTSGPATTSSVRKDRKDSPLGRTCEDRGFQIYMTGLSQLQLGKIDDALDNFERAVTLNKTLYDAHYRIALISLLKGNNAKAERQIRPIERILKRCGDCEAREEIIERRDHLHKALSGAVSLQ